MILRFYIDPATDEPHIYEHGIDEAEVEDILTKPVKIGQVEMVHAWRLDRRVVAATCA